MEQLHLVPYPKTVRRRTGICREPARLVEENTREEDERYSLEVGPEGIRATGGNMGLLRARATLQQLRIQFGKQIPCLTIEDAPDRAYRGFMLDVCRHWMLVENIKRLLDAAAFLKLNRFHWHLTDDQGWRIQIRRWPELTAKGARRGTSCFGGCDPEENNDGFYTQKDAKEIVRYAERLGIEVIPEIELPGHASAALAAYPWLGCELPDRDEAQVMRHGGIFDRLLCAGKDETLEFLKEVLSEIAEIFPSPYVHIGGDEALKLRWRRCPCCQRRIAAQNLTGEDELQRWMVLRIGEYLLSIGKRPIVWNDVLSGGELPETYTVQFWLGDREKAFIHKGSVINSDTSFAYLDYPASRIDTWKILSAEDALETKNRTSGMEFPLWTEHVSSFDQACMQLFPRLAAGAERAWRGGQMKSSFAERWKGCTPWFTEHGMICAPEESWRLQGKARVKAARAAEADRGTSEQKAADAVERRLLGKDAMERLMQRIGMDDSLWPLVSDERWGIIEEAQKEARRRAVPGLCKLAAQLDEAAQTRASGCWQRYPQEIYLATMGCFSRFVKEYRNAEGRWGFDRAFWTKRQIRAKLFRVGTLEYELLERGAAIHIPSDADLSPAALHDSYVRWLQFAETFLPGIAAQEVSCTSWLLSPALEDLLPEDSRIRSFRSAFQIVRFDPEPDDVLQWVFGLSLKQMKSAKLDELRETTSLQRHMKAAMLKGTRIGEAEGRLVSPW